jgi:hypothetical protein
MSGTVVGLMQTSTRPYASPIAPAVDNPRQWIRTYFLLGFGGNPAT